MESKIRCWNAHSWLNYSTFDHSNFCDFSSNSYLRLNGFKTATDEQLADYGGTSLMASVERSWGKVKPLYTKLHSVVRWKLNQIFGSDLVDLKSPLPAHLMVSRHKIWHYLKLPRDGSAHDTWYQPVII